MRAPLFLISLALSSAACSDGTGYAERAGVETEPTSPTANATPVAAKAQELEEETDRYLFAYGWPAEASAEPGLAKIMRTKADALRTRLVADADERESERLVEAARVRARAKAERERLAKEYLDVQLDVDARRELPQRVGAGAVGARVG